MRSFVIGRLLEPEERCVDTKDGKRYLISTAVLSGRYAVPFDVWQDDDTFEKLRGLQDGDTVCAVVGDAVDGKGKARYYMNDVALCPEEIRDGLRSLFAK